MSRTDTTKVVERLMFASGVKTQVQLADTLGISQAAVTQAISKGKIPEVWLYKVAHQTGRRVEWLRTGEGPEFLDEAVAQSEKRYGLTRSPALKELLAQRASLTETEQTIIDRAIEMLLSSDGETRTLMLQVLETVHRSVESTRQQRRSEPKKKLADSA